MAEVVEPEVIFVDNHLLVVNKPMGMLTQPDLEEWAKKWMQRPYCHAVHRLDRSASGIVVLAKTSKALGRLNESLRQGHFQKKYRAIVSGLLDVKQGRLKDFLIHDEFRAKVVKAEGKIAELEYCVMDTKGQMSIIEVKLLTGRYHQIRVQFASRGHPILGDKKYGSRYEFSPSGIALHHHHLVFPHPTTEERLSLHAPFPACWKSYNSSCNAP